MRFILFGLLLAAGCAEEAPPKIAVSLAPVNLGVHVVAPDMGAYSFNLQVINMGEETLVIDSTKIVGDTNCAFTFEGPDVDELELDQSAFLLIHYDPVVAGEDQTAIEIVSNAKNAKTLEVPMCATAVNEGDPAPPVPECEIPPADQADCSD